MVSEFTDKSHKSSRELERQIEENSKLLSEINELKDKLNTINMEKDALQKKLTKEVLFFFIKFTQIYPKIYITFIQIQLHENEIKIKTKDHFDKVKCLEDNHAHAMFELRQLLNMQQRMSNK
jgi:hypothetical protein